ncbi:hypothetical protein K0M31_011215 [Melipona bicolor]|uniref:Uncharacterized protein n=1 Tax=Melipona bicolor TaxID=60889 RepID=A0AA40G987_9HYME|nr:hypothetical protein K0M31_011215 [Melipona bicolor]
MHRGCCNPILPVSPPLGHPSLCQAHFLSRRVAGKVGTQLDTRLGVVAPQKGTHDDYDDDDDDDDEDAPRSDGKSQWGEIEAGRARG